MNEREKKKLASAVKRTTDLSLDNPSQHPLHYVPFKAENTSHDRRLREAPKRCTSFN